MSVQKVFLRHPGPASTLRLLTPQEFHNLARQYLRRITVCIGSDGPDGTQARKHYGDDWAMNERDHSLFSELIARYQGELYAYIFAIVRNWEDADDLFQTVCVVLWTKFASFRPGSSFFAWSRQIAKIEVRSFLRAKQLPIHVSETLLDALAETTLAPSSGETEVYVSALEHCRQKLNNDDGELLDLRYVENLGTREIADRLRRPQQGVCHSLKRIRRGLLECIQLELARQEHPGSRPK
jgi:RNA polymerase sigma-70 factor, ECF subfamily